MPPLLRRRYWRLLTCVPAVLAAAVNSHLSVLIDVGATPGSSRSTTAFHNGRHPEGGGVVVVDSDSDERITRQGSYRRPSRRLASASSPTSGEGIQPDSSRALFWNHGNETTCFVTSVKVTDGGDTTTNITTYEPDLTAFVPGCGNSSTSFLELRLLADEELLPSGPSTASAAHVRNASSGVFGTVHKIYAGANYSLDLVVQLNLDDVLALGQPDGALSNADDDANLNDQIPALAQPPEVVVGYVRLVFCDALHIGSCDDALRSSDTSLNSSSSTSSSTPSPYLPTTTDYTNVLDNFGNSSVLPSPLYPNHTDLLDDAPDSTYLPLGRYGVGNDASHENAVSGILSSPWLAVTLRPTKGDSAAADGTVAIFRARHIYTVSLPNNITSGAFFVMGHSRFLFDYAIISSNSSTSSALNGTRNVTGTGASQRITRLDMTRTLSDAAAFVTSPPFIQTSTEAIKFYLIVMCVLCGAFALLCFASIIYYRSHPVMTLSQGSFLAALVAACFIQIVFAFMYLPTVSIYCTLAGPLELIPMHVGGAILVARVWRAYSAIGVAALIGRRPGSDSPTSPRKSRRTFELLERWHLGEKYIQVLSWLARLPLRCLGKDHRDPMRHTVRKKVTAKETASLAVMLSLPQVILQVFGAAYYQRGLVLELDATESVGRYLCEPYGRWVDQAGIGLVGLVYIGAVAVAWIARLLPSVFNEKNQVFHAAFVNCLIAFITLPLLELTNDPTDSPDVQVFLRSLLSIGIAMTNIIVLVLPKLRRVWSGEKVVLTTVLDARFKAASTAGPGNYPHAGAKTAEDERINLKEGDPLPYALEQQVLRLHDVLRTVEDRCCEGRPLARDEWSRLREYTHSLNAQLLRVDITYNQDTDEEESPTS